MLEFNPDGSLKLTLGQVKDQEIEKRSIIITREQVSVKPAKAQVRIKLPENFQNPEEIVKFYSVIDDYQFRSVEHSIQQMGDRTFLIKVDKGSMLMYELLNFIIDCFKSKYGINENQNVIIRGTWDNFGNGSCF